MTVDLLAYKSILFDCDGVILNSNKVKTQAFFDLAEPWGLDAQNLLVKHHVENGGISRHKKIHYLLNTILPLLSYQVKHDEMSTLYESLVSKYADLVYKGLLSCDVSPVIHALRKQTSHVRWSVVSGGDQVELNKLFSERGLLSCFDAGIFGSPDDKKTILNREFAAGNFIFPALFIGDSKYDFISASSMNVDFLFLSDWTEFREWQSFVAQHKVKHLTSLAALMR